MKKIIKSITMTMSIKHSLLFFTLIFSISIVKAQSEDEKLIIKTIETFFDGFTKSDTGIIYSTIDKNNFTLQTIIEKNNSVQIQNEQLVEFIKVIAKPKKEKWIEKIESYKIQQDGNYANAWCKYVFFVDTTFYHWGIDNIQLIKTKDGWKIFSIIDTRNKIETYEKLVINENAFGASLKHITDLRVEINSLMDKWHKAAATGDEKIFFGSMDPSCIYLGTDKTENWTKESFEIWSKKYFEKDKAWDFTPYDRHIYFSADNSYAWFDELLKTWMGVCRGSGVLHYENGKYKLMHYNLAVTVANEKVKEFVKINK